VEESYGGFTDSSTAPCDDDVLPVELCIVFDGDRDRRHGGDRCGWNIFPDTPEIALDRWIICV
jgi:hypothetical protein